MDITSRDPNLLISEKQAVIQRQKNKIMSLAKEIKTLHAIIHDKTKQINKLLHQQIQNDHVKKYIHHCIDNEQNLDFLKRIHQMIGKYLQQTKNIIKLTEWTAAGNSARTTKRHVSEVLDMIVGKAQRDSGRVWALIQGLVDRYKYEVKNYLQITNRFSPPETTRFQTTWRLTCWQMQGS
eukprot:549348_1